MKIKSITPEERALYNVLVESSVPSKKKSAVLVTEDQKIEAWEKALAAGVDPITSTNIFRDSPANIAIYQNLPNLLETVLENGVNPNIPNNRGMTALHMAVDKDNNAIDLLLAHGADIHQKDLDGKTALDYAREKYPTGSPILNKLEAAQDRFIRNTFGSKGPAARHDSFPTIDQSSTIPQLQTRMNEGLIGQGQAGFNRDISVLQPRGGLRGGYQGAGFSNASTIGGIALIGGLIAYGARWISKKFAGKKRGREDAHNNTGNNLAAMEEGGIGQQPSSSSHQPVAAMEEGRAGQHQSVSSNTSRGTSSMTPLPASNSSSSSHQPVSPPSGLGDVSRALFPSPSPNSGAMIVDDLHPLAAGGGTAIVTPGDGPMVVDGNQGPGHVAIVTPGDGPMVVDGNQGPGHVAIVTPDDHHQAGLQDNHHDGHMGFDNDDYDHDHDHPVEQPKKKGKSTPLRELRGVVNNDAGQTLAEIRGLRSASASKETPQFNIGSSDAKPKNTGKSKKKGRSK